MPSTRRVVLVREVGKVEIETVPMEPLPAENARLFVDMNGVCGTDMHYFYDPEIVKARSPLTLGHEWVGTITEMGSKFPRHDVYGQRLKVGDRVVALYFMCGECYACKVLRQPNLCTGTPEQRNYTLPRNQGGFGDYMQIPRTSVMMRVPDDMPTETAVLMDPMAVGLGAVERAISTGTSNQRWGLGVGKTVVIQGSGPIGICCLIAAKQAGVAQAIVLGAPPNRLDLCKQFGADHVIDFTKTSREERAELVRDLTPNRMGPDAVIETAGVPVAFEEGIALVRRGGTFVEVGHYSHRGMASIDPYVLCQKHIHLYGSWIYTYGVWSETFLMLQSTMDKVDYPRLVTHRFTLDESQQALEASRDQTCMKAVIVGTPSAT